MYVYGLPPYTTAHACFEWLYGTTVTRKAKHRFWLSYDVLSMLRAP